MQDLQRAVIAALRADAALAALLGDAGRVRTLAQDVVASPPVVTVFEVVGSRDVDFARDAVTYQVDCWGGRHDEDGLQRAEDLFEAARAALHERPLHAAGHRNVTSRMIGWRDIGDEDFAAKSMDVRVIGFAPGR